MGIIHRHVLDSRYRLDFGTQCRDIYQNRKMVTERQVVLNVDRLDLVYILCYNNIYDTNYNVMVV